MTGHIAFAFGLVGASSLLVTAGGCSTTSAGGVAADGSVEAATLVIDAQTDAPIACASGYDCSALVFTGSTASVPCCTDKVCRLEPYDDCTDATVQIIQASNYDQACTVDKDCVAVSEGNFCYPGTGNCPNAAISRNAYAQYQADVAKTRAASCYAPGSCGDEPGPCCVAGKCQAGLQCPLPAICCSDAGECGACPGDAGADAAGSSQSDGSPAEGATVLCTDLGRFNSVDALPSGYEGGVNVCSDCVPVDSGNCDPDSGPWCCSSR